MRAELAKATTQEGQIIFGQFRFEPTTRFFGGFSSEFLGLEEFLFPAHVHSDSTPFSIALGKCLFPNLCR